MKRKIIYIEQYINQPCNISIVTENKTYNISLNKNVSVEDVANKIVKMVKTGEVRTKGSNGVVRKLDTETAIKELKFKPAVNIDQGLKLYYKWISTKK